MEFLPEILLAAFSAMLAYLLGRRKTKAEIDQIEIGTIGQAIKIYKQLADDLQTQVDELKKIVGELSEENRQLKNEINRVKQIKS